MNPDRFATEVRDTLREVASDSQASTDVIDRLIISAHAGPGHGHVVLLRRRRTWIAPMLAAAAVAVVALVATSIASNPAAHRRTPAGAGLSASPTAPASGSGLSTTSAKPTHVAVPVSTPTGTPTPTTPQPAACLTPAAALALVQEANNATEIQFQTQPGAYACQGGWAVVNYITTSTRNHSTVDLQAVNGTWVFGDRIAACGSSGYGSGAMPLPLQSLGCGN